MVCSGAYSYYNGLNSISRQEYSKLQSNGAPNLRKVRGKQSINAELRQSAIGGSNSPSDAPVAFEQSISGASFVRGDIAPKHSIHLEKRSRPIKAMSTESKSSKKRRKDLFSCIDCAGESTLSSIAHFKNVAIYEYQSRLARNMQKRKEEKQHQKIKSQFLNIKNH
jgi:hypothetical protein